MTPKLGAVVKHREGSRLDRGWGYGKYSIVSGKHVSLFVDGNDRVAKVRYPFSAIPLLVEESGLSVPPSDCKIPGLAINQ